MFINCNFTGGRRDTHLGFKDTAMSACAVLCSVTGSAALLIWFTVSLFLLLRRLCYENGTGGFDDTVHGA